MAGTRHLGQSLTRPILYSKSFGTRQIGISRNSDRARHRQEQVPKIDIRYKSTRSTDQPANTSPRSIQGNMTKANTVATSQSKNHAQSNLRIDAPLAVHEDRYSGRVLPFPDKLADTLTARENSYVPITFIRTENDVDHYRRVDNARRNEIEEEAARLAAAASGASDPTIQGQSPSISIRRPLTDGPDPFLPERRGTGKSNPVIYEDVPAIRARRRSVMQSGGTIGFVPTMGALHQGHLDLMKAAAHKCSEVWVSIYVNPTQFGANEDLSTYPSTWQADLDKIEELNDILLFSGHSRISTIFRPRTPEVLYPYGVEGTSHVLINPELTQILEGSSRPTFFRGVTTVVMKLLNIIQPEWTFFGQKDFQQFAIIKRMIKEFHLPVHLERVPTTREPSGLAMSSRNAYLGQRRLNVAPVLHNMLSAARKAFNLAPPNERTRSLLVESAMKVYTDERDKQQSNALSRPQRAVQFKLDYLSLADPDTLQEIPDKIGPKGAVMSLAIVFQPLDQESIGDKEVLGINGDQTAVRLIDNMLFDDNEKDVSGWLKGTRLPTQSRDIERMREIPNKRQNNKWRNI